MRIILPQALGDIKHCILATDLASFFSTQASINDLADTSTFDWDCNEHKLVALEYFKYHFVIYIYIIYVLRCSWYLFNICNITIIYLCRRLLMATTMTASDLCAMYKPWSVQRNLVDCIMEEFWQQVLYCYRVNLRINHYFNYCSSSHLLLAIQNDIL